MHNFLATITTLEGKKFDQRHSGDPLAFDRSNFDLSMKESKCLQDMWHSLFKVGLLASKYGIYL